LLFFREFFIHLWIMWVRRQLHDDFIVEHRRTQQPLDMRQIFEVVEGPRNQITEGIKRIRIASCDFLDEMMPQLAYRAGSHHPPFSQSTRKGWGTRQHG
jgi:hypothetical protein